MLILVKIQVNFSGKSDKHIRRGVMITHGTESNHTPIRWSINAQKRHCLLCQNENTLKTVIKNVGLDRLLENKSRECMSLWCVTHVYIVLASLAWLAD